MQVLFFGEVIDNNKMVNNFRFNIERLKNWKTEDNIVIAGEEDNPLYYCNHCGQMLSILSNKEGSYWCSLCQIDSFPAL
jgi:hypothetical protein